MINPKIIIVTVAVLWVLNSIAFAQESSKPAVNVAVIRDGVKIEQVILSKGSVQVSAPQMNYDVKTKVYELIGNSAITIHQDDSHSLRLKADAGEKALLQASQIEYQIYASQVVELDHFAPIRELNNAVQKYPDVTSFRVWWDFGVFTWRSEGVALYNRKTGTIIERVSEGSVDHTLFSGVADKIINQMAQDAKNRNPKAGTPNQIAPFYFDNLTRYGCKSEKLQ